MFGKKIFHLFEDVPEIQKYHHISGRVHALKVAVLAVKKTVHHAGGIVKMLMSHILAHLSTGIDKFPLFHCKYQCLGFMLPDTVLFVSVKYILIMVYFNDLRLWKMSDYFFSFFPAQRIRHNLFLNIYMRKRFIPK